MTTYDGSTTFSAVAGEDLSSAGIYRLGIINSSGKVVKNTTAQGPVDCVIGEAVVADVVTQCVAMDGKPAKGMAGDAITNGALVASNNVGKLIPWVDAAGNCAIGRAMEAATADGDIIKFSFGLKKVGAGS